MKRVGNLCAAAFSREALYQGYYDARRGKRTSRACYLFERRLAAQIEDLRQRLLDGSYCPRPYNTFQIFEPKQRTISARHFAIALCSTRSTTSCGRYSTRRLLIRVLPAVSARELMLHPTMCNLRCSKRHATVMCCSWIFAAITTGWIAKCCAS